MESDSALSVAAGPSRPGGPAPAPAEPFPSSAFNIEPGTSCSRAPALVNSKIKELGMGSCHQALDAALGDGAGFRVQPQGPSKCSPVQLVTAEMRSFPESEMPLGAV